MDQIPPEVLNGPALAPPPGVVPDFDTKPPLNGVLYAFHTIGTVLGVLFILLRIMTRLPSWRTPHIVDIMTILLLPLFIGFMYFQFRFVAYGDLFIHQWNVRLKDIAGFFWIEFRGVNLYLPIMGIVKSAILFEWIRILCPGNRNAFFWSCTIMAWVIILFNIADIFAFNFACTPYEKNWNRLLPGTCINVKATDTASAVINLACDIITLVLPQRTIWNLQLKTRKKLSVASVFGIGLLACISAAFRLESSVRFYTSDDATYTFSANTMWGMSEAVCGIIVLCAPSVPKALNMIGQRSGLTTNNPSQPNHVNSGWSNSGSRAGTAPRSYYKMNENGTQLSQLEPSKTSISSTEPLHTGEAKDRIIRTTHVMTTAESYVQDERRRPDDTYHPWVKDQV